VTCRPNGRDAERRLLGSAIPLHRLEAALRRGIQKAAKPGPQAHGRDMRVTAFLAQDSLALGLELEEETRASAPAPSGAGGSVGGACRFQWGVVPYIGMETQLAGAMAALAAEGWSPQASGALVIDPACGTGTLLLAAARLWPGVCAPRVVGRDVRKDAIGTCRSNVKAVGLDATNIEVGDARELLNVGDGEAAAVICDLPCGRRHRAGADASLYDGLLTEAARVLRPGGRCVLLSTRREMLGMAAAAGPWRLVLAWPVGRGRGGLRESQLLVLERERSGAEGDVGAPREAASAAEAA